VVEIQDTMLLIDHREIVTLHLKTWRRTTTMNILRLSTHTYIHNARRESGIPISRHCTPVTLSCRPKGARGKGVQIYLQSPVSAPEDACPLHVAKACDFAVWGRWHSSLTPMSPDSYLEHCTDVLAAVSQSQSCSAAYFPNSL
jgi:hypothetical protein